jgi:hypothetical protein
MTDSPTLIVPPTVATRRQLLKTLAVGASGFAFGAAQAGHPAHEANPPQIKDPTKLARLTADHSRLLLGLRYGAYQHDTYWWLQGRRYAAIENELIPLFDIWVGFAYRRLPLDQRTDHIQMRSRVLYTALDTDELLTSWKNPLSNRDVRFEYASPSTQTFRYDFARGLERMTVTPDSRQEREDHITGVRQIGQYVFIDEEARVKIFSRIQPNQAPRKVHDRYMWSGTRAALDNGEDAFSSGEVGFMDMTDWSPRLGMGDIPGCAIAHCSGRRSSTLELFPDTWHHLHLRHELKTLTFDSP